MTNMIKTTINGRWDLLLPEHRHDRPSWPWWEATRLAAMHHFIKPGDVVYDIGAEEGDFPALYASWGAKVVLFEPNPKVWPNIRAIFEANNLEPYGYHVGFAGDRDYWPSDQMQPGAVVDMTRPYSKPQRFKDWPECAYGEIIGDHGFMNLSERPDIITTKIDSFSNDKKPNIITIDTEGSELNVLEGAKETLVKYRPIVFVSVHAEFMKDMYDTSPSMIDHLFEEIGYHKTYLGSDHEDHIMYHPERSYH